MGGKRSDKYDWRKLFVEWCGSGQMLPAFFRSRGIEVVNGYKKAKKYKWMERRTKIEGEAWETAIELVTEKKGIDYAKQIEANEDLLVEMQRHLKRAKRPIKDALGEVLLDEEGHPQMRGLTPDEIVRLSTALEKLVKTKSFMAGGPSERTEGKVVGLHADVTKLIHERRQNPG